MGKLVLGTGYWVCRLIVRNHSENKGEVKGNRLKNVFHRKTAQNHLPACPGFLRGATGRAGQVQDSGQGKQTFVKGD